MIMSISAEILLLNIIRLKAPFPDPVADISGAFPDYGFYPQSPVIRLP